MRWAITSLSSLNHSLSLPHTPTTATHAPIIGTAMARNFIFLTHRYLNARLYNPHFTPFTLRNATVVRPCATADRLPRAVQTTCFSCRLPARRGGHSREENPMLAPTVPPHVTRPVRLVVALKTRNRPHLQMHLAHVRGRVRPSALERLVAQRTLVVSSGDFLAYVVEHTQTPLRARRRRVVSARRGGRRSEVELANGVVGSRSDRGCAGRVRRGMKSVLTGRRRWRDRRKRNLLARPGGRREGRWRGKRRGGRKRG